MSTPIPNFDFIIDLHCHPTYKPVGASYKSNKGIQDPSPSKRASIWNYDSPGLVDKLINEFAGLTKFSQSNFSAATYGQVFIITVALGSIEKWFLNNDLGTGNVADVLENFLLEIGKQRINSIQNTTDYFIDLKEEMDFLAQMDGKQVKIDGKPFLYKVVSNFNDLNAAMVQNETALNQIQGSGNDLPLTIAVIPSIEGMHVLNCGLIDSQTKIGEPPNVNEVLENAGRLKQLKYKPFFVTFTHHFYNQLCGHSKSLNETVARFCRQENGMGQSFTETGKKVLDILLDNTNNDRILVDIKHLSPQGRKEFFTLRNTKYQDVPIIVSHGAANGMPSFGASVSNFPEPIGKTLLAEEINFYDDEILLIEESKGIFGLQLDERRIANKETLKHISHSIFRNKIMHYRSELLWNQIQYIAELLDANGRYAWGTLAIGSDYDGIVDPLNSFWTIEQYPALKAFVERYAYNYFNNPKKPPKLTQTRNIISADTVVQNIFRDNAWRFFELNF